MIGTGSRADAETFAETYENAGIDADVDIKSNVDIETNRNTNPGENNNPGTNTTYSWVNPRINHETSGNRTQADDIAKHAVEHVNGSSSYVHQAQDTTAGYQQSGNADTSYQQTNPDSNFNQTGRNSSTRIIV